MLKGERQVKLLEAVQIAAFLRVSQERGLAPRRRQRPRRYRRRCRRGAAARRGAVDGARCPRRHSPDLVPIRSAGRGGNDQEMFLADGPIGYTPRPANLDGVRSAYAIYMVGDSMEPRYEQGWLLHVNPFKPPIRGRDVVVYKSGQAVLIKQFIGWQGDELVLRQLNPDETLRIPRVEVVECHLVVGVDQEGERYSAGTANRALRQGRYRVSPPRRSVTPTRRAR